MGSRLWEVSKNHSQLHREIGVALGSAIPNNATPARLTEFNMYINTTDEIPEGQTIVQWWGVS